MKLLQLETDMLRVSKLRDEVGRVDVRRIGRVGIPGVRDGFGGVRTISSSSTTGDCSKLMQLGLM